MQNTYQENYAICKFSDLDSAAIMRGIAADTIGALLLTMGVELPEQMPKEAYITVFLEEFMNNGDWILKILPAEALDLLLDIWDQIETAEDDEELPPAIWVEDEEWEYLQYLRLFGLVTYKKGNSFANEPNIVYIVREMKDAFYFHLRSKNSQRLMEQYDTWETVIRGLMCYYGVIDVQEMYHRFMKAVPDCSADLNEFLIFLRVRSMLWSFGSFLRDNEHNIDYYMMYEVENPNQIIRRIQKYPDLTYKEVGAEDLIYVSEAAGIDNRWEGITTIGTFLIDEVEMDYYRTTVFIRTMISMIHNGYRLGELKENALMITAGTDFSPETVYEGLEQMYYSVPVFELRGYSRREYDQMRQLWIEEKRKKQFRVIRGGD